ncbi:hypothetical protein [Streptomyces sp. NPDC001985]|uniref:hypothetical protein n=1 Tax=Streptomyces sp. NPDC001985 TaxID=3154406 RepID=UPI003325ACE5
MRIRKPLAYTAMTLALTATTAVVSAPVATAAPICSVSDLGPRPEGARAWCYYGDIGQRFRGVVTCRSLETGADYQVRGRWSWTINGESSSDAYCAWDDRRMGKGYELSP